jgi:single-strand DNA-binding protein
MDNKNYITLAGRTSKEFDIRYTSTGKQIADGSIAINIPNENVRFFNIVAWEELAAKCERITKGTEIAIKGKWQYKEFTKNNETKKYIEITMYDIIPLQFKKSDKSIPENPAQKNVQQKPNQIIDDPFRDVNNDIPF